MHDNVSPVRQIISAMVVGVVVLLLLFGVLGSCKADYVAEVGATWCAPCQAMKPITAKLRKEGHDIRHVDIDQRPDWKRYYGIRSVPTFIYIAETAVGQVECARMVGPCSENRLRAFCHTPVAAASAQATSNTFHAIGRWLAR